MLHNIYDETTLYYLGADNRIREWSILVENNTIIISHGHLNGIKTTTHEEIERGKGGRSIYNQIQSRIRSRINTQRLKGYKDTIEEAQQGRTNALDLPKPMLAQPWNKVKNINLDEMYVQYKYDGNRCLIVRRGKEIIAYSRKGKIITSIDHILHGMDIPEDIVIDGELYHHGTPLSTIRSWIARDQPDTKKLRYHAYDVVLPLDYKYRLKMLHEFGLSQTALVVPTFRWDELNDPSIKSLMTASQSKGYEGLILRNNNSGYEVGKRSKALIKVKSFLDSEFTVLDIFVSEKGMPMATCFLDENKTFDVVLPGTKNQKRFSYINKETFVGKSLTIEFSQWTPDGIPFHAVAKCWND